jgi:hypothetical protein
MATLKIVQFLKSGNSIFFGGLGGLGDYKRINNTNIISTIR